MKYMELQTTPEGLIMGQMIPETEEEIQDFEKERKWWEVNGCHCKDRDEIQHIFVDDDVDPNLPEHHWICPRCGGVVQIG